MDDRHTDEILRRGRALREDARALAGEIRGAATELGRRVNLTERLEKNPYGTLLVAAGIGYVLGGGLFTRTTARIARIALKGAVIPLLRGEIAAMGRGFTESAFGRTHEGDEPT